MESSALHERELSARFGEKAMGQVSSCQDVNDFYRFFGLSWETSTVKNYHSQDSRRSGSRRIEFSSKRTTSLM